MSLDIIHLIPSNDNTQIIVGKDAQRQFAYTTNDGTVIDITGFTITGSIKNAAGTEVLALPAVGDGVTTGIYLGDDPTLGVITMFIEDADSTATGAGDYTYSVTVTDGLPKIETVLAGKIEFWTLPY